MPFWHMLYLKREACLKSDSIVLITPFATIQTVSSYQLFDIVLLHGVYYSQTLTGFASLSVCVIINACWTSSGGNTLSGHGIPGHTILEASTPQQLIGRVSIFTIGFFSRFPHLDFFSVRNFQCFSTSTGILCSVGN